MENLFYIYTLIHGDNFLEIQWYSKFFLMALYIFVCLNNQSFLMPHKKKTQPGNSSLQGIMPFIFLVLLYSRFLNFHGIIIPMEFPDSSQR